MLLEILLLNEIITCLKLSALCFYKRYLNMNTYKISLLKKMYILGHLRPSRELLEYYRKKIAEYDDEHDQLVKKLEEYRVAYEEQVLIA